MEASTAEQATEAHQAQQQAPAGAARTPPGGGQGVGALRPSDVDFMPGLLRSLSVLMRLRGKPVSPQLLLAGLSGSQITPRARRAFPGASRRGPVFQTSRRWCCRASCC